MRRPFRLVLVVRNELLLTAVYLSIATSTIAVPLHDGSDDWDRKKMAHLVGLLYWTIRLNGED